MTSAPTSASTTPRAPRAATAAAAITLAASLLAAVPHAARAQVEPPEVPRYARAFERAVTFTFGASSYGERLSRAGGDSRYRPASSFVLGTWFDQPITRRTGLLIGLAVAPVSGQREYSPPPEPFELTKGRLIVATADVGLAGRLKPSAPVFFMVSGGVLATTKGLTGIEALEPEKKLVEPHGSFTIGIDGKRRQRWGWRMLYVNRWTFPKSNGEADFSAPSTAHDWTFQIGLRRTYGTLASR